MHERPVDRLTALVESAGPALAPYLDKPFAFFGHSLGALLAYELARFYRRHGGPQPVHLFVSGCRAPQIGEHEPPLHVLPDREFVEQLRRLGGTPPEVLDNRELLEIILPFVRADFAVCETYRHAVGPPLKVPITAFGGSDDGMVTEPMLAAWGQQTEAPFRLRLLPGAHFFLQESEAALLACITGELAVLARSSQHANGADAYGDRMSDLSGRSKTAPESVL
jgi:medium-chain acyl-[acyl-carrier-protein] hydrolase